MKKWVIVLLVVCSVGVGVFGASALYIWAHLSGRIEAQATLFMETQEFKDAVSVGHPFKMGDFYFVPSRDRIVVQKIRFKEGN